ncbi:hypothetical protein AL540_012515 [Vibrio harveyi]|nr:hypothetical protein AL540_012515 [Vibrio harveyi]SQA27591.1 Uncharacterised protein [Vibrio harveyi]
MPCLKEEFRDWIRIYSRPFRYSICEDDGEFGLEFLYTKSGRFLPFSWGKDVWEYAFKLMHMHYPETLSRFINEYTVETTIIIQFRPHHSLPVIVLKSNRHDCSKFNLYKFGYEYCDKSLMIYHESRQTIKLNNNHYYLVGSVNYCDYILEQSGAKRRHRSPFIWHQE